MSIVKSFAVGNGDMFYIRHNSDNFTIIDCNLNAETASERIEELRQQSSGNTKCVVREALRSNRGKQQKADFRNTKCVVQEALRKLYDCPLTTKSALFGSVIDETYQEEHVRRLPTQRAIALRSPCGTGKTKATHELLKELSEKTSISVVWVVHRKAVQRGAAETAMLRRQ